MYRFRASRVSLVLLVFLCIGFKGVIPQEVSEVSESESTATTTSEGLELEIRTENDAENSVLGSESMMASQRSLAPGHILTEAQSENRVEHHSGKPVDVEVDELDAWEAPFNLSKDYIYYLAGHDEENRPIWIFELGRWNVRPIVEEGGAKLDAFNKYVRQMIHRVLKSMTANSTPDFEVTESMFLIDFEDLKLEQLAHVQTVTFVLNLAKKYLELLALHLGGTVIVNTNFVAENLINILRPVYGPLLEKVEVYGNNKAAWLPKVLRKYPRDQIPQWYGGSKDFKPIKIYGRR